ILQLGHHGSNTSSDPAFIQAVDLEVAIYSAGADNAYGHPHPEVVSLIQDAGITLYGTDVHGTILVTTDGKEYDVATKEDGTITPESTGAPDNNARQETETEDEAEPDNETPTDQCVDLNQASLEELQEIIHIGPARAQDVIDQRPYDSVDDLTKVNGIGPARIADIDNEGFACTGGRKMKGVLDRIEDNDMAVILIEEINKELIIPLHELPSGSKESTWFHIEKRDETFEVISIDSKTTSQEAEKSTDLMKKLQEKRKDSKFKKR